MATTSCLHKIELGCILTAVTVCCSCADKRPLAPFYPIYRDGVGMTMTGYRWQKYCWKCRDYWTGHGRPGGLSSQIQPLDEPVQTPPWSDESPGWAFPTETSELSGGTGRASEQGENLAIESAHAINVQPQTSHGTGLGADSGNQTSQSSSRTTGNTRRRRPPRNPFGTREEWESPDYQSPLEGMFSRAWNRYRDAENNRQREEQEIEARLRSIDHDNIHRFVVDGGVPAAAYEQSGRLTEELRRVRQLAEDMAQAVEAVEGITFSVEFNEPPRPNPIDAQSRPPPLSEEQMTVSIACRVCNEQKIDTLAEPCMHLCMCHWCSEIIRQQFQEARRRRIPGQRLHIQWQCPVCRKEIQGVRRVYFA